MLRCQGLGHIAPNAPTSRLFPSMISSQQVVMSLELNPPRSHPPPLLKKRSLAPVTVAGNCNHASGGNVCSVFVYGSLLADDVVRALLRRLPQNSQAILHGYHRFSVKGRVYPAILPVDNKKITGRVLFDITAPELDILDKFEDYEYERRLVDVSLLDGFVILQAYTYVWANSDDPDLYGEWDFEVWKASKMKDMTMGFVEEQEQAQSKPRVATYKENDGNNISS